jgi:hypothetical protein
MLFSALRLQWPQRGAVHEHARAGVPRPPGAHSWAGLASVVSACSRGRPASRSRPASPGARGPYVSICASGGVIASPIEHPGWLAVAGHTVALELARCVGRKTVLPGDLWRKYENDAFWRDPARKWSLPDDLTDTALEAGLARDPIYDVDPTCCCPRVSPRPRASLQSLTRWNLCMHAIAIA